VTTRVEREAKVVALQMTEQELVVEEHKLSVPEQELVAP
jgi:hypothetical protein